MRSTGRDVGEESASDKLQALVRDAIQRTIVNVEGHDVRTVSARLENELASLGLQFHHEWILTVAEPISRGERPPVPPLRFSSDT